MKARQSGRTALVAVLAAALCVGAGWFTRVPAAPAADTAALAKRFAFAIEDVNGDPARARSQRVVQPALEHIRAWISAVGAAAGLGDLDGDGLSAEACLVDPRDDSVTVRPVPSSFGRFPVFPLVPAGLAFDAASTAPMGCVPADLNEDGWTDVLVHFWGRTPIAYLRRPGAPLAPDAFRGADVAPHPGEIWNSSTANVVDLDGDGHLDLVVGNYFPDGARVLDGTAADDPHMRMHDSMSKAANAGTNRILRLERVETVGGVGVPRYADASAALSRTQSRSWTLATGAQDLDGDGLPELYLANDFGPDQLLHNRSTPGRVAFTELRGAREVGTPKSKALGDDSFKSMGVAFTDIDTDGRPDLVVSNITVQRGLEESNFAFVSTGTGPLRDGHAPYRDDSEALGLSRSGWGWDVKAADFDGDGTDELVQAVGFVRGRINRWANLQELAMANDDLLRFPQAWPNFEAGTDISGRERDPFFVRGADGRYVDIARQLGIDNPGPSRGIAVGDVDHDGRPDVLIANQWARSQFLHNTAAPRAFLGLRPLLPGTGASGRARPAVGASVTVTRADGTVLRSQLYPANGHTGVNAPELLFGLGAAGGPASVAVTWRDAAGLHTITRTLPPGWHDLTLGA
ncbi:CRTAC1 family protein [Couchioplanes azureus]|uniref:CRTAC1 family protein n=1 Tax=Couchioplanes caeruleus TaxID=56438 RepID=UPI00166F731E|nr:CRTAC1 family protein [Couchioplanes caeruleus]GGQ49128.1 RNA-binding protein [Couchioplanes caeruleus subsp. azureus]